MNPPHWHVLVHSAFFLLPLPRLSLLLLSVVAASGAAPRHADSISRYDVPHWSCWLGGVRWNGISIGERTIRHDLAFDGVGVAGGKARRTGARVVGSALVSPKPFLLVFAPYYASRRASQVM
jgi:hypothetical protein